MYRGVSPDGRKLAVGWDRKSGSQIQRGAYLLDLRSGRRAPLEGFNNAAAFSPDDRRLVSANYASDSGLRTEIVELDRFAGELRTYASAPSAEWLPSYSRDGEWIVFNSTRSGGSDVYRVRRRDGRLERLTEDPRYEAHAQLFDRDRRMLFHRQIAGDDYAIVEKDLADGSERSLADTPAEEAYPALSPDGRWIAFSAVTAPGRQPHLFVMRSDGTARRQLTDDASKDAYAAWSPDGRFVYFVRFHAQGSEIYRVGLRAGRCGRP